MSAGPDASIRSVSPTLYGSLCRTGSVRTLSGDVAHEKVFADETTRAGGGSDTIAGPGGYCTANWGCDAGADFMARSTLTHNLVEDRGASAAVSYSATGTATNGWGMQMLVPQP